MSAVAERAAVKAGPPLSFFQARNAAGEMRRLRRKQELTQAALGALIGKSQNWVGVRERGALRIRRGDAEMVAAALGTSLAGLIADAAPETALELSGGTP